MRIFRRLTYAGVLILLVTACKFKPYNGNDRYHDRALLPGDEAPHYKNSLEWWYFTGHLTDNDSNQYGVEYVFFHFNPRNKKDYMMANIAISDPANNRFLYDYKILKRKDLLETDLPLELRVEKKDEDWVLDGQMGNYHLSANMVRHPLSGLSLDTSIDKPILLHDGTGYEEYGEYATAGYYSYPRLDAKGLLFLEGDTIEVKGELWYDRQWNCVGVWQKEVAWDWISVQFKDMKSELMLYLVYHKETGERLYGGSYFNEKNEVVNLQHEDITFKELDYWVSPNSKSKYPVEWEVKVSKIDLNLHVKAIMKAQELQLKFTPIHKLYYWEGMCSARGYMNGKRVEGNSYVEITNRN